jgi:hypothetical protein
MKGALQLAENSLLDLAALPAFRGKTAAYNAVEERRFSAA